MRNSTSEKTLFGWRELFYLGAVITGIALISRSGFSVVLLTVYIVFVIMAVIAQLLGK